MSLKWTDSREIALDLIDAHPDVDPKTIRFTDLYNWVLALPNFTDVSYSRNTKFLNHLSR